MLEATDGAVAVEALNSSAPSVALIWQDYKVIASMTGFEEEAYDLRADPDEQSDLAAQEDLPQSVVKRVDAYRNLHWCGRRYTFH